MWNEEKIHQVILWKTNSGKLLGRINCRHFARHHRGVVYYCSVRGKLIILGEVYIFAMSQPSLQSKRTEFGSQPADWRRLDRLQPHTLYE